MEHGIYRVRIEEKRDRLNKFFEEKFPDLLRDEILEVSKELDIFIERQLFSENIYLENKE